MKENSKNRSPRNQDSENIESVLMKKEQDHRHKTQARHLTTFRLGQFLGFLYNLALLYLVYNLIQTGEKTLALKIFALNAAIVAFVLLTFLIEKRLAAKRYENNKRGNYRRPDNRNRKPNHSNQNR